ncbi:SDR family oxidoreductase [Halobacillus amylolyticus]|uniref:SDR family oxidoreductase n=1 Tax=Halobacillus amylolyticus TaxID=2932259 RepID=A0ABY4H774_9BACI|nr:SDR family oxidoreductase [Halobacillus amylolyticus]UOR10332.1 SDR family oxidoreductase [Halobacillus amylolyticus]
MRVLVIGANGQVGKYVIDKLNDSGHEPVAMVRDTDQVPQFEDKGIRSVIGDLEKDFESAFYNIEAVIFAAGSGPHTGADKTILIDQEGAIRAIERAKHFGIKRFVMLSSMAADRPESGAEAMKHYLYAKHRADEYLKQSGLDYTIVRPGRLTNDRGNGKIKIQEHINSYGEIPREDVAETLSFLISGAKAENKAYDLLSGDQRIHEALAN